MEQGDDSYFAFSLKVEGCWEERGPGEVRKLLWRGEVN